MAYHRDVRAEDVLPPELVVEIQKHFKGGRIYVPSRKSANRVVRDLEIVRMFNDGKTITEIAETYLLTRGAVRYVLRKAGRKAGMGK